MMVFELGFEDFLIGVDGDKVILEWREIVCYVFVYIFVF